MKVEKVNNNTEAMLVNLLKNVKGLKIENHIINNCLLLLDERDDIAGTISYEQYGNYALIRYFVFKKNTNFIDLFSLYQYLENDLKNNNVKETIAIISSNEVEDVFTNLGFKEIDKNKVYFDETLFENTIYNNNKIYAKKIPF